MRRLPSLLAAAVLFAACSGRRSDSLESESLGAIPSDAALHTPPGPDAASDGSATITAPTPSGGGEPAGGADGAGDRSALGADGAGAVLGQVQSVTCGNGALDPGEQCDDGPGNSDSRPDACRVRCAHPACGDNVRDANEACDQGTANAAGEPDACRTDCTLPHCGDGVRDRDEECDTGALRSDTEPGACRTACKLARCGDGVRDPNEACDDANSIDTDACRIDCRSATCGDGVRTLGEECDDGNVTNGDGCQSTCRLPICGDGVLDRGEACDDGNSASNDGCRSDCTVGCTADSACDDARFCNGAERCVDGRCQLGGTPRTDDGLTCTRDACSDALGAPTHSADDTLCPGAAPRCANALLTTTTPHCLVDRGCSTTTTNIACPGRSASSSAGANGSFSLTTFSPSCSLAGDACAEPLPAVQTCAVPAPACNSATRIGTVFAAICDAAGARCGSQVAQTNDCTRLDGSRCAADQSSFTTVRGACSADGSCTSTSSATPCATGVASCSAGSLTTFRPTCTSAGCGQPAANAAARCPVAAPRCEIAGGVPSYVTFAPSCSSGSACSPEGTRTARACNDGVITCETQGSVPVEVRRLGTCTGGETGGCGLTVTPRACRGVLGHRCNGNFDLMVRQEICRPGVGCVEEEVLQERCTNSFTCNATTLVCDPPILY